MQSFLFYVAATGVLAAALGVVLARSPMRGALSLILSLCSLAVLYVLLEASFVAAMQVLVYAGAIMVLFLFVIMLLNLEATTGARPTYVSISKVLGSLAALFFVVRIVQGAIQAGAPGRAVDGSVKRVGTLLLTDYLFAFEAVSLVLLVAVVGAVVLGLKRLT